MGQWASMQNNQEPETEAAKCSLHIESKITQDSNIIENCVSF